MAVGRAAGTAVGTVVGTATGPTGVLVPVAPAPSATVVVCGSGGPLADALVARLLGDGERVVVVTAPGRPAPAVLGDRSPEVVEHHPDDPEVPAGLHAGVDVVLHVAGGPEERTLRGLSTTGLQTLSALRLAHANGARLVVASLPANDERVEADEAMVHGYRTGHDVDCVVARVAGGAGPYDDADLVEHLLDLARSHAVGALDVRPAPLPTGAPVTPGRDLGVA